MATTNSCLEGLFEYVSNCLADTNKAAAFFRVDGKVQTEGTIKIQPLTGLIPISGITALKVDNEATGGDWGVIYNGSIPYSSSISSEAEPELVLTTKNNVDFAKISIDMSVLSNFSEGSQLLIEWFIKPINIEQSSVTVSVA